MNVKITPKKLSGEVKAVASKSYAHRALICGALASGESKIMIENVSKDIEATLNCLNALGAKITHEGSCFSVTGIDKDDKSDVVLDCGESGSTLRFMVPIVAALGRKATFLGQGKLLSRPMDDLSEQLALNGANYDNGNLSGKLNNGTFYLKGNVSSQYVTGLLFALALLNGESKIVLTSNLESKAYVDITSEVLANFGVKVAFANNTYSVSGNFTSNDYVVEGDWSNAAFFLAGDCVVSNLNFDSPQGDKAIKEIIADIKLNDNLQIDAQNIPDLVPIIATKVAIEGKNCTIFNAQRLIYKESNRIESVYQMLSNLGVDIKKTDDGLIIKKSVLKGGVVDSFNDHRIVMSAAIAGSFASGEVIIKDSGAVNKSYPTFFEDFKALGGIVEVVDE